MFLYNSHTMKYNKITKEKERMNKKKIFLLLTSHKKKYFYKTSGIRSVVVKMSYVSSNYISVVYIKRVERKSNCFGHMWVL